MFTIGTMEMENRVVSAPLAGVTDKAYRMVVKDFGCGLIFSEMISDMGLIYQQSRTKRLADTSGEKGPVGMQIFGSDPEAMAKGARILEDMGAQIIDINMGCPTPKIIKNGEGSALLLDLKKARQIIHQIIASVSVPVTIKMRKGWNDEEDTYLELAGIAEQEGAAAITLHPRSRTQFFSGHSDWTSIRKVKERIGIPVIGNGDIWTADDAVRMMDETRCDAVMIGRGALGNPFLFRETVALIENGRRLPPPTNEEKLQVAIHHLDLAIAFKGESVAVREMRKHLSWYIKGMRGAAQMREHINRSTTREEIMQHVQTVFLTKG
ncbi:MAG: tRNA dihydrouridine synthase DusB [Bacillota bacterium]|nr:tRNA dihydrouridine synthase DusB [Bacillota bacterium]